MKYNISNLIKEFEKEIIIAQTIQPDILEVKSNTDIEFISPIQLDAKLTYNGKEANLKGNLSFEVQTQCDRCLDTVKKQLIFPIDELFTSDEDDENYNIINYTIDILPVIYDNLYLQLPTKFLCKENCKGICIKCGKNKNIEECNCKDEEIDSRFAVLKNYLKNNKNK